MNEIEEKNRLLSKRLYNILDMVGASEDERTMSWETALMYEAFNAMRQDSKGLRMYRFGSVCEGTTTAGLNSDMDLFGCIESFRVVENIQDASEYGKCLLMIADNTKPGYVHLQHVLNRIPQTIYDREINYTDEDTDSYVRIYLKHILIDVPGYLERNGPAVTKMGQGGFDDVDLVVGLPCKEITSVAKSWLRKQRVFNWPPKEMLYILASYGCFFVSVGHPQSQNKSIERRISFSVQERELMRSLNSTQHKCYILLKMIKKDIVQHIVGKKSISSYHCKTCLFHVVENSRPGFWTRGNLVAGIRICVTVLLHWAKEGICPNYFIPGENMFDRLNQDVLDKVAKVLTDILRAGTRFLTLLACDHIGLLITLYDSGVSLSVLKKGLNSQSIFMFLMDISSGVCLYRNRFMEFINVSDPKLCLRLIFGVLQRIKSANLVRFSDPSDSRFALQSIEPHFYLQIAQSIASVLLTDREIEDTVTMAKVFVDCIHTNKAFDLISSKLLLATCYLKCDMFEKCEEILLTCETLLDSCVVSICRCRDHKHFRKNESLVKLLQKWKPSPVDFRRNYTTVCMLFLPGQANLVYPALQLEMYRSVYTLLGSRDVVFDYWFDWILVDSQVYLYFLQYILYGETDQHDNQVDAINNMQNVILTDGNLGHRETALNLLGWIYSQENEVQLAINCFFASWNIRPDNNAAKWHLAILLAKLISPEYI